MEMDRIGLARRTLIKGIAVLPIAGFAGYHSSGSAAMLSVDDPIARSRGYIESSSDAEKCCSNCKLFVARGSNSGRCAIFSGTEVAKTGFCNLWMSKN